jgi:2'-5' RNA ligase
MKPRLDPRIFLALPLSETVQSRLAAIQQELKLYLQNWHFVPQDNFHVTLKFFGEVPERSITKIHQACCDMAPKLHPFSLEWNKLDFFGPPQAARVLFVSASEVLELTQLAQELLALFPGDDSRRRFRAHITLAKARKIMDSHARKMNENMLRRLKEHGRIGPQQLNVDIRTFHREFVLMETIWVGRAVEYKFRETYTLGEGIVAEE